MARETIAGLKKQIEELKSRNAHLSELNNDLAKESLVMEDRYEQTYMRYASTLSDADSLRAAMEFWYKKAQKQTRDSIERGRRRAELDPNFALFRDFTHLHDDHSPEAFVEFCKKNKDANLPGLVRVANEFGMKVDVQLVSVRDKLTSARIKVNNIWVSMWEPNDDAAKNG